jgi:hypothetical protein
MLIPAGPMRVLLVAASVALAGAAFAQGAPSGPTPGAAPSAAPSASGAARGKGGAAVAPNPAQAAAAREAALDAQAKKAREEQERRIKERDRKLQGLMGSICRGC